MSDWSSDVFSSDLLAMQLAAFLDPSLAQPGKRDWRTKIRQMRAGQALASNWSHKQMLEAYFNLVPLRGEAQGVGAGAQSRSEEHTSELQSLMRISYAVFCLKKKKNTNNNH